MLIQRVAYIGEKIRITRFKVDKYGLSDVMNEALRGNSPPVNRKERIRNRKDELFEQVKRDSPKQILLIKILVLGDTLSSAKKIQQITIVLQNN